MSAVTHFSALRRDYPSVGYSQIDIGNLRACIADVRRANASDLENISIPTDLGELIAALKRANSKLPRPYQLTVGIPLIRGLEEKARSGSKEIFINEIEEDAIRAVLFHSTECVMSTPEHKKSLEKPGIQLITDREHHYCRATRAVQEMISDLFDGWLEYEKSSGVKLPERQTTAPLHTWGPTLSGPFTWTVRATNTVGLKTALVSFPLVNSRGGLLAWTALAHEVSGHDFLHADIGLLEELKAVVSKRISRDLPVFQTLRGRISYSKHLAKYWSERIDETASDVLGLLNLGPSAGIGLIGYFRGLSPDGKLRTEGPSSDSHPADILRGLLSCEVVARLPFSQGMGWAQTILKETLKDYPRKFRVMASQPMEYDSISLADAQVPYEVVRKSTSLVADAIMNTPLRALEGRSLSQIRLWGEKDEQHVAKIRAIIRSDQPIKQPYPKNNPSGYFAEHVVAGATIEALTSGANIKRIFRRMTEMLETMNKFNPTWNPKAKVIQVPSVYYFEPPQKTYNLWKMLCLA